MSKLKNIDVVKIDEAMRLLNKSYNQLIDLVVHNEISCFDSRGRRLMMPKSSTQSLNFKRSDIEAYSKANEKLPIEQPQFQWMLNMVLSLNRIFGITVDYSNPHRPIFDKGGYKLEVCQCQLTMDGFNGVVQCLRHCKWNIIQRNIGVPKSVFKDCLPDGLMDGTTLKWMGDDV